MQAQAARAGLGLGLGLGLDGGVQGGGNAMGPAVGGAPGWGGVDGGDWANGGGGGDWGAHGGGGDWGGGGGGGVETRHHRGGQLGARGEWRPPTGVETTPGSGAFAPQFAPQSRAEYEYFAQVQAQLAQMQSLGMNPMAAMSYWQQCAEYFAANNSNANTNGGVSGGHSAPSVMHAGGGYGADAAAYQYAAAPAAPAAAAVAPPPPPHSDSLASDATSQGGSPNDGRPRTPSASTERELAATASANSSAHSTPGYTRGGGESP